MSVQFPAPRRGRNGRRVALSAQCRSAWRRPRNCPRSPQQLATPTASIFCCRAAYLVLARLSLPSQDLIDVGARWHIVAVAARRVRLLLRFAVVHGRSAKPIDLA